MLAKAISIASEAFKDKVDKGGKPYILHLLRVMFSVDQSDEELMIIAIFHDFFEDFPECNCQTLRDAGFSERVVLAVLVLTHAEDVSYEDYIKNISLNTDATKVKLADLKDNSNYLRLKKVNEKSFESMKKYHKAYMFLSSLK